MEHVHKKFPILTFLPIHSNLLGEYREKGYFEQKYRDYWAFSNRQGFNGNIGMLEGLYQENDSYQSLDVLKKFSS